jgi:hypothetical protein
MLEDWRASETTGFSTSGGGIVCENCRNAYRDYRVLEPICLSFLTNLDVYVAANWSALNPSARRQVRQVLSDCVVYHLGRMPRLLNYLS